MLGSIVTPFRIVAQVMIQRDIINLQAKKHTYTWVIWRFPKWGGTPKIIHFIFGIFHEIIPSQLLGIHLKTRPPWIACRREMFSSCACRDESPWWFHSIYGGSINGGTPIAGWLTWWKFLLKPHDIIICNHFLSIWIIVLIMYMVYTRYIPWIWGTPHDFGNLQMTPMLAPCRGVSEGTWSAISELSPLCLSTN